jgi:phage gpG-like protein
VADLEVRIDMKALQAAMRHAPERLFTEIRSAFRAHGSRMLEAMKRERIRGGGGAPKADHLTRRSGNLSRSFRSQITGSKLSDLRLTVYTTSPYAPIHEHGGEVKAKRSRFLTIPLGAAKTAGGVAQRPARSFPGAFFFRSRRGSLILARRLEGGGLEPLFVLKERVQIPARLGFLKTWKRSIAEKWSDGLNRAVARALSASATAGGEA